MREIELDVPAGIREDILILRIEESCAASHLTCTLKATLTKYPGSVHWHFKQEKQKGILEITWWKKEQRLWFKVADNRTGEWISVSLPKLKEEIEKQLNKS
jgi:hypothetical protein